MVKTLFWVCTQLKVCNTCAHLYSILEYLYHVPFARRWYSHKARYLNRQDKLRNSFFLNFHCSSHIQIEYLQKRLSVSPVSHPVQIFFCMEQGKNLFCVSRSTIIIQLLYDVRTFIIADSRIFFPPTIVYDSMPKGYLILYAHRFFYVGHVIFPRQSAALFVTWNTRSIHTTPLKPLSYNLYPQIEKICIGIRAVGIYAMVHLQEASDSDLLLTIRSKNYWVQCLHASMRTAVVVPKPRIWNVFVGLYKLRYCTT